MYEQNAQRALRRMERQQAAEARDQRAPQLHTADELVVFTLVETRDEALLHSVDGRRWTTVVIGDGYAFAFGGLNALEA